MESYRRRFLGTDGLRERERRRGGEILRERVRRRGGERLEKNRRKIIHTENKQGTHTVCDEAANQNVDD